MQGLVGQEVAGEEDLGFEAELAAEDLVLLEVVAVVFGLKVVSSAADVKKQVLNFFFAEKK